MKGEKEFTFTWKLDNFSMCPHQSGSVISSPPFVVSFLEKTEWQLLVFPREDNNVSCYLKRTADDVYKSRIKIGFMVTVLSSNTEKTINLEMKTFNCLKDEVFRYSELCSREDLFGAENELLPNDTLTLICKMCRISVESNKEKCEFNAPIKLYNEFSGCQIDTINYNWKASSKSNEISVRTCIKVGSEFVLWPIERFSALRCNESVLKTISFVIKNTPTFELKFCLTQNSNSDQFSRIEIRRIEANRQENFYVRGKIRTLGTPKSVQFQGESEHYFRIDGRNDCDTRWEFPISINRKELLRGKHLFYTNDVLYLSCEFKFSTEKGIYTFQESDFSNYVCRPESFHFHSPRDDYQRLYRDAKFSDVTLRVGFRTFRVHKCVLSSRSPVFNAMFDANMQESKTGFVDIKGLEEDIVNRMLAFIYTDMIEDLTLGEVIKLYAAADQYQIESLKCRCCCMLISTLSVLSVCEVLALAVAHQDKDMLDAVFDFIHENTNEVFCSQKWKDFVTSNECLAKDTMLHIFSQKVLG